MDDVPLTAPATTTVRATGTAAPSSTIAHERLWIAARWLVVAVVAVGGILLRRLILETPLTGATNADEATTGLMALNILRGHVPLMLPGQPYSGTLEAFLVAPIYGIFGTSTVALKLVNVVLWGAAAVMCYVLGRLVLTRLGATAAGLIVWVPGLSLTLLSTLGYPGYVTGFVAYLTALFLLGRVAEADRPTTLASLAAGFASGLAAWLHPMYGFIVLPALLVVTWRHRKALVQWAVPAVAGVVLGLLPFLVFNLRHGWASLHQPGNDYPDVSYVDRLYRFAFHLWPRTLGLRAVNSAWIFPGAQVVYVVAIGAALVGLALLWRRGWAGKMLAVTGLVSPFLLAVLNNLAFYLDGRYGIDFLALFAIGICSFVEDLSRRIPTIRRVALLALPVLWLVFIARIGIVDALPKHQPGNPDDAIHAVIDRLEAAGIDRVRASYFIAQPLVLASDERILAAVPIAGPLRFPYLQQAVDATDPRQVAFIFVAGDPVNFEGHGLPLDQYDRVEVGPYVLYLPRPER